jgi:hypothetical protein
MLNGNHGLKIAPKTNTKLSKQHEQFNKLIEKIEKLKARRIYFMESFDKLRERYHSEIAPLAAKATNQIIEAVFALDRAFQTVKLPKRDRELFEEFIVQNVEAAIDTQRARNSAMGEADENDEKLQQLEAIFEKYSGQTFAQMKEEEDEMAADMMEMMFGIRVDPSKVEDEDYMNNLENEFYDKHSQPERPKTKKQLEKEAERERKATEAGEKMQKDLRSVYTDLVKELHPDGEQDPARQLEKTEMMKRVTAAYEEKDLYALLQIQLEIEQLDNTALSNLSDDKMSAYMDVLKRQIRELEAELNVNLYDNPLYEQFFTGDKFSENKYKKLLKETKDQINYFENLERYCTNPNYLKKFLKEMRQDFYEW